MLFAEENKVFIEIFVPDYSLWTTETYERVPWQRMKSGLDNLVTELLKKWTSSAMHDSGIPRTVRRPN